MRNHRPETLLKILLNYWGFSCAEINPQENLVGFVKEASFGTMTSLSEKGAFLKKFAKKQLNKSFSDIQLILDHGINCLVPIPLYDYNLNFKYLQTATNCLENTPIKSDFIENCDLVNVFQSSPFFKNALRESFSCSVTVKHGSNIVIRDLINSERVRETGPDHVVYVVVQEKHLYLTTISNKQTIVNHIFLNKGRNGMLKSFISNNLKAFKINPDNCMAVLLGKVSKTDPIVKEVGSAISNIHFGSRNFQLLFDYSCDNIKPYEYNLLLSS